METDAELKRDVEAEIAEVWKFDTAGVGVIVKEGVVTLTGAVRCLQAKWELQEAAQRVSGVGAVVNTIHVTPFGSIELSDGEIAQAAEMAIGSNTALNKDVQAAVVNGQVTLTGTVPWRYQKREAEDTIRHVTGVRSITNKIIVKPAVAEGAVEVMIESALQHHGTKGAGTIQVSTEGTRVTLEGRVDSWRERQDAEKAALATPGVTTVDNRLVVAARYVG